MPVQERPLNAVDHPGQREPDDAAANAVDDVIIISLPTGHVRSGSAAPQRVQPMRNACVLLFNETTLDSLSPRRVDDVTLPFHILLLILCTLL